MIELDAPESKLVLEVLKNALGDLRMTIADTENYDWRQAMKRDEVLMKSIIAKLETEVAATEATTPPG